VALEANPGNSPLYNPGRYLPLGGNKGLKQNLFLSALLENPRCGFPIKGGGTPFKRGPTPKFWAQKPPLNGPKIADVPKCAKKGSYPKRYIKK